MTARVTFSKEEALKWDFFELAYTLQKQWEDDLRNTLPKTESGWFEIFPEARGIIEVKIAEWEEIALEAKTQIRLRIREIESKTEEKDRWFWLAVLKHTEPSVRILAIARRQIRRLSWLRPKKTTRKSQNWIESLERARTSNLVDVAKAFGLQLRKSGQTYHSLCPFHNERRPSFHIYPPSRFVCFGCSEKGDVIAFVQKISACSFKEAVLRLQTV